MTARPAATAHDLVPLADRMRQLRLFRCVAAALVLAAWLALPEVRAAGAVVPGVTAAWLTVSLLADVAWAAARRRALWLVGLMLVLDGGVLAWLGYLATPADAPLRLLVVVHLVAVCLLASFRTGLRLTMWYSLLLVSAFHGREAGVLGGAPVAVGDAEYRALAVSILVLWVVAIATSAYGAVNERELRRRRYDLEALGRLSAHLESRADAKAVGRTLAVAVADDFDFRRVLVLGTPPTGPVILHSHGFDALAPSAGDPAPVVDAALAERRPLLVAGLLPEDDAVLDAVLDEPGNLVLVPMHADGEAVGLLVAEHSMRPGSRVERRVVSMLERYASHAAHALRNAWLVNELERFAMTDGLTGTANRRTFDAELARELARAHRSGRPVGLALLDVDHFKRLNDTFGHLAGDQVLTALGRALRESVRAGDVVARYGGEEFAVILPGLDERAALSFAERMRALAGDLDVEAPVTVSAGVASFPAAAADPLSLIAAADRALYAAKGAGRDRAVASSAVPTDGSSPRA